jgi:hypothetical protein
MSTPTTHENPQLPAIAATVAAVHESASLIGRLEHPNAHQKLHFTMAHIHNGTIIYRNNASVFRLPLLLLSASCSVFVIHSAVGVLALVAFTVR